MSKNINRKLEAFNCQLLLQTGIKEVRQGGSSHRRCSLKKLSFSLYSPFSDAYLEFYQKSKTGPSELEGTEWAYDAPPQKKKQKKTKNKISHVKVPFFLMTKLDDERFCWKKSFGGFTTPHAALRFFHWVKIIECPLRTLPLQSARPSDNPVRWSVLQK